MRPIRRRYSVLFSLISLIVLLDQIAKHLVLSWIPLGESRTIIPDFFDLTYVRNTGAAFGILAQAAPAFRVPFFVIVPLVALVAIGYVFKKIPETDVKLSAALSLVIGGAVGNLVDRMTLGFVVDFLDFHWGFAYHFPAFNIADSASCIGVGILMLDLLIREKPLTVAKDETHVSAPH